MSNGYFEMKEKKSGDIVRVYHVNNEGVATIWRDQDYYKQNGNGWATIKLTKLMPVDYKTAAEGLQPSKTERNKIKSQLKLTYAQWKTTDGLIFTHDDLEEAISHQRELNEKNKKESDE